MTLKERFLAAVRFQRPDMPALEYYYTDVGYAEHGAKLHKLYRCYPGDTAPIPAGELEYPADDHDYPANDHEYPVDDHDCLMDKHEKHADDRDCQVDERYLTFMGPDPADFDAAGNYRRLETDKWGTTWEYRVFGRIGHAIGFPLDDISKLDKYIFPPMPLSDPATFEAIKRRVADEGAVFPISHGIPGLLEQMIALRPFDKVLMDLTLGEPALIRLADMLTEIYSTEVNRALSAGVDIIRMGDDYGTSRAMLISPDMWRAFFFPRLKSIFEPIKAAGKLCCFHSCGQIWDILPDLKRAGADSIWPQLPLYDYGVLSKKLRELGLALCIHIDRGELMQHGAPSEVKAEVARLFEAFRPDEGGSWFYFEVDQGFPFENIQALAEAIAEHRR